MTDSLAPGTAWLVTKTLTFTVLVPGTVVVLVPYLVLENASLAAIDFLGPSLLGLLPLVLGAALYLRCAFDFAVSGRGTPAPIDPPRHLVKTGPYRYSRNPMYVGVLAIVAGEALLYRSLRLLLFLLVLAALFHLVVIVYEERVLGRLFGEAYARYRREVPRWIPAWSALKVLHEQTFLEVGTLVLVAGSVAHVLRLSVGLPVIETPSSLHAFLVVLPSYAVLGCLLYAGKLALVTLAQKVIFGLICTLLAVTAVMHAYSIVADDNSWLGIFPMWYSVIAAVAYGGFALFLKTRTLAAS